MRRVSGIVDYIVETEAEEIGRAGVIDALVRCRVILILGERCVRYVMCCLGL